MTDQKKIRQAVRLFLEGIGEDPEREGLKDTPDRIARMCGEIYGGMDEDAGMHLCRTFSVDNSEMVVEKDITFFLSGHHVKPEEFTLCVNIMHCRFTEKHISRISRTGKSWD